MAHPSIRKSNGKRETTPMSEKMEGGEERMPSMESKYQLPKLHTPGKYKEGNGANYFKNSPETIEHHLVKGSILSLK